MTDEELAALHIAAEETPVTPASSGLFAVIAHCCDWELHRRRGIDFNLQGPHAAIGPEDMAESFRHLQCSARCLKRTHACRRYSMRLARR